MSADPVSPLEKILPRLEAALVEYDRALRDLRYLPPSEVRAVIVEAATQKRLVTALILRVAKFRLQFEQGLESGSGTDGARPRS